jgi:hypothetical protein
MFSFDKINITAYQYIKKRGYFSVRAVGVGTPFGRKKNLFYRGGLKEKKS